MTKNQEKESQMRSIETIKNLNIKEGDFIKILTEDNLDLAGCVGKISSGKREGEKCVKIRLKFPFLTRWHVDEGEDPVVWSVVLERLNANKPSISKPLPVFEIEYFHKEEYKTAMLQCLEREEDYVKEEKMKVLKKFEKKELVFKTIRESLL